MIILTKKKTLFVVVLALCVIILAVVLWFLNQEKSVEVNNKLDSLKITDVNRISTPEYDVDMAIEKGICKTGTIDDNFLNMQALYKKAFDSYLYTSLNIEKYDKVLEEYELRIIPDPKERNEMLSLSEMPSEYICGLNTIHIEQLDIDSIRLLQKYLDEGNTDIDDELLTMAKDTFPVVLSMNILTLNSFEKPKRSLQRGTPVIGICHYPEFDEVGDFVDIEKDKLRRSFVHELALEMQEKFSQEFGCDVLVLAMI